MFTSKRGLDPIHGPSSRSEPPISHFEPPAIISRVHPVYAGLLAANDCQIVDRGGETHQTGYAAIHVQGAESEPVEVHEDEVETLFPRPHEDDTGVVVEMLNAALVLQKGKSGKLFQ